MPFSRHTKIEIFIEDFYLSTIVTGATVFCRNQQKKEINKKKWHKKQSKPETEAVLWFIPEVAGES